MSESLFWYSCRLEACHIIKKEIPAQKFSCEFYKIFKNSFFTEYLLTTSFVYTDVTFQAKTHSIFDNLSNNMAAFLITPENAKLFFWKLSLGLFRLRSKRYNKFSGKEKQKSTWSFFVHNATLTIIKLLKLQTKFTWKKGWHWTGH